MRSIILKKTDLLNSTQILLLALNIVGFESISFLSSRLGESSQSLSILYRLLYLILCVIILINIPIRLRTLRYAPITISLIFWVLYLTRSVYDTFLNPYVVKEYISNFWPYALLLSFIPFISHLTKINYFVLNNAKKLTFRLTIFCNLIAIINNIFFRSEIILTRYSANELLNPITYGQIGVMLIIMTLSYSKSNESYNRLLFFRNFLLVSIGLVNIGLSASRGPLIELISILIFYIVTNIKKVNKKTLIVIISLIILFIVYLSSYLFRIENLYDRFVSTSFDEERISLFSNSFDAFLSNPIFGVKAIGEFAHNIILGSMEALGIIGGIIMIIIYYYGIKHAIKLMKDPNNDWIAMLLIMHFISSLVSGSVWNSFAFWSIFALSSNLVSSKFLIKNHCTN